MSSNGTRFCSIWVTRVKSTVPSLYWATTCLTAFSASSTLAVWNFAALLGLQEGHQAVLHLLSGGEDRALVSRHELLKPCVLEPNVVHDPPIVEDVPLERGTDVAVQSHGRDGAP